MMRYWVVDSETTGVDDDARAVEIAGIYCEGNKILDHYQTFVDPGISIPAIASAIHHIVDRDVKGAPSIDDAMVPFFEKEFDFVVAHNSKFDARFMDFGECPWVCTWKLANKVYPDAPSYSNQVLRYHLGLKDPVIASVQFAHRALYDSEVTTYLFQDILSKAITDNPLEGMVRITNAPIILKKCGFGKHQGKLWSEVPRDYLDYILNKSTGWDENTLATARYYYNR